MEFETVIEHSIRAAFPNATPEQVYTFAEELMRQGFSLYPLNDIAAKAQDEYARRIMTERVRSSEPLPSNAKVITEEQFDEAVKSGVLPKQTAEQVMLLSRTMGFGVSNSPMMLQNMGLLPIDGRLDELARAVFCTMVLWHAALGSKGKEAFLVAVINNLINARELFRDAVAEQQKALN